MKRIGQNHPGAALLAVASICVSLLGVALALHPVHVPAVVFWGLIGCTTFIALTAIGLLLRRFVGRKDGCHHLTGLECRRLSETVGALWTERQQRRPRRTGLISSGESRQARWVEETEAAYAKLKAWAMGVFEEAIACNVMSDASRPLIERPPAAQLYKVRDLFREAADELEGA